MPNNDPTNPLPQSPKVAVATEADRDTAFNRDHPTDLDRPLFGPESHESNGGRVSHGRVPYGRASHGHVPHRRASPGCGFHWHVPYPLQGQHLVQPRRSLDSKAPYPGA